MAEQVRDILSVEEIKKILNFIHKGYYVPKIIYDTIFEIAKREIEEKKRIVLCKRDPNIGKGRIQAFYPKIVEGEALEIYPPSVVGFGADFDGDSIFGYVKLRITNLSDGSTEYTTYHIYDLKETPYFSYYKTVDHIDYYKVNDSFTIEIEAIDSVNGDIGYKRITEFTIHRNLKMYKIEDTKKRFETFWVSEDHSLIAYDKSNDKIVKVSPLEIRKNPENYFLLKSN
jgi:hypothetical protein